MRGSQRFERNFLVALVAAVAALLERGQDLIPPTSGRPKGLWHQLLQDTVSFYR